MLARGQEVRWLKLATARHQQIVKSRLDNRQHDTLAAAAAGRLHDSFSLAGHCSDALAATVSPDIQPIDSGYVVLTDWVKCQSQRLPLSGTSLAL